MPQMARMSGMYGPLGKKTSRFNLNKASGGTYSTFQYDNKRWARHLFSTTASLSVTTSSTVSSFVVTLIAGGGDGGYADCPTSGGTWGGGGGGYVWTGTLSTGTKTATVGSSNGSSSLTDVGTVGYGGHGCRSWNSSEWSAGAAGTWGGNSTGSNGEACGSDGYHPNADVAACCRTLRDGYSVSTWGARGACMCGNPCGRNYGGAGVVVVEYEIDA